VEGAKFLDYGCGDGWITQEICKRGVMESWGYDIKESRNWSKLKGKIEMCSKREELPKSPNYFDAIMLYDVLDHCENPVELMAHVRNCVKHTGTVYVRCHPWTSKHATHLFKHGVNKAYLHLFLNWNEIKEITKEDPMFTRPEKNAVEAYHWWFKDFEIKRERFIKEPVSDFFHVPAFKELLANEQQVPLSEIDAFLKLMEVQFVNYCLVPK
jgi:SAM-dependent methyltransferase